MTIRHSLPRWPALLLIGAWALTAALLPAAENTADKRAESEARLKKDIFFLASDECEGRGPTTKGINKAADYIAAEFKKAGLKPGGPDGSYFQPFTIPGAVQDAPAVLKFKGPKDQTLDLKDGDQFYPMGMGGSGKVTDAAVVFAGYGTAAGPLKYDDYAGLEVEGKVVVVLRDVPRIPKKDKDTPQFPRAAGSLTNKIQRAEKAKAAAIVFVSDADTVLAGDDLLDFNYTALGGKSAGKITAFHLKRSVLETMLKASGAKELPTIEADINQEVKPQSFELKGWTVSLELKMHRDKLPLKNIVGVLEGNGPLAKETVVVGAHYDHLGYGGGGGSLAGLKKMAIHHGADDNGSGTTSVMEMARRFAAMKDRQGRRLVFMCFSGEELGLDGSRYYAAHPLFPLADTVAMFNLDMVGRLPKDKETLLVEGSSTSKTFNELVDNVNKNYGFQLKKSDKFIPNSDHASFYTKKIPVLFFWTGIHPDYHRPSDTADKINIAGMCKIVDMSVELVQYLATVEAHPDYVPGKVSGGGGSSAGNGPRLGIRPAYDDEKEGVLVDGVADGYPAAKAGLKAGDRIVELAGKPIKNLQGYMDVMALQKAGNTIESIIERDGKKMNVKIKLE